MSEFDNAIRRAVLYAGPSLEPLILHVSDSLAREGYVKDRERNQAHEAEVARLKAEIKSLNRVFDTVSNNLTYAYHKMETLRQENRQGRELLNEIRNVLHHPVEGLERERWTGEERLSAEIRLLLRKYNV